MIVCFVYGNNKILVRDLVFPASEKSCHNVKVTLGKGSMELGRYFPVPAEYKPIDIKITWPQYANNYYPGQDARKVAGKVNFKLSDEDAKNSVIELKIGDEVKKLAPKGGSVDFQRKFPELKEGQKLDISARLLVAGKEFAKAETSVRRLPPPEKGGEVVWIQDGHIVRNGKVLCDDHGMELCYLAGKQNGIQSLTIHD